MEKERITNLTDMIGVRIMGLFLTIIIIATAVFEIFYVQSLYSYFYDNVSGILESQARYNAELFLSYVSDDDLHTVVMENKNQFYRANTMQVQILNNDGTVLFDNRGTDLPGKKLNTQDVAEAQKNKSGIMVGNVGYSNEPVMSLSYPLRNQTAQVGMIRLTTSLTSVNAMIAQRIWPSIAFCIFIIAIVGLLSFWMSRSIVRPIHSLTAVAAKLADGQYEERADETPRGEIGELARTMNLMSDNIREKEEIKNDFISSVSHELRTPLTSIKGWAITLQSEGIKPELVGEGLKIIEKESERLGSMVEDLLDFSRYSSGKIKLSKSRFNLVEIANHILLQMRPRVQEKHINMNYNYAQPVIEILGDEGRIKQVLLNVLDNAIKFTEDEGTVFLSIEIENTMVRITVSDTGIGISEEDIAFVTEKFWKGSSSQSHTGLGLSICEEIIRAHGGSLTIKSKLGVGTSVSATLPYEAPKEMKEKEEEA